MQMPRRQGSLSIRLFCRSSMFFQNSCPYLQSQDFGSLDHGCALSSGVERNQLVEEFNSPVIFTQLIIQKSDLIGGPEISLHLFRIALLKCPVVLKGLLVAPAVSCLLGTLKDFGRQQVRFEGFIG